MDGKEENMREIIFSVKKLALDLENSFPATTIATTNKTGISWRKLEKGCWKLNTDESFVASTNCAAAGGLLRDEHGKWSIAARPDPFALGFAMDMVNSFSKEEREGTSGGEGDVLFLGFKDPDDKPHEVIDLASSETDED
ncbi:hypothetical protein Salat_0606400 [Sesamum alatum]|uniref:Uncharacterized protein n=1 Tax=Sesamum alatum TaxID=300844 RepID=A0AAE2CTX6_9LAMI|nr:hypothetical protein Salat_0606400 [Sesamum alatum]